MGCIKAKNDYKKEKKLKLKLKEFFMFEETNPSDYPQWKNQACYYSHLIIMLKWIIKNKSLSGNLTSDKFEFISERIYDSLNDFDEYDLISLENKIKFILNKNIMQAK